MTKTNKLILGLGIVTASSFAALPHLTHATNPDQIDISVNVHPVIALEIIGNNDVSPYGQVTDIDPDGVTFEDASGNPITESAIKTSSSKASLSQNQLVEGNDTNGFLSTLKVSTNDQGGYTLKVAAKTSADVNLTDDNNHSIDSVATATTLTAGDGKWGLQAGDAYSGTGLTTNSWSPITTAGTIVKTSGSVTTPLKQDTTQVKYGVATGSVQPAGIYSATLSYTATTAN
ncbi:hypothetical protein IJH74_02245 [Candidatus Saccharibacteria bacterium]|nr:hypothetical protein [Candidatus Saccharibacteria bacterium]